MAKSHELKVWHGRHSLASGCKWQMRNAYDMIAVFMSCAYLPTQPSSAQASAVFICAQSEASMQATNQPVRMRLRQQACQAAQLQSAQVGLAPGNTAAVVVVVVAAAAAAAAAVGDTGVAAAMKRRRVRGMR
jgi:hypothetical protein